MEMITEGARELIVEALRAKAEAGARALEKHEEFDCTGDDCEWDFPGIVPSGTVDGVVESVHADVEAVVDFILECVEQWCRI